MVLFSFSKDLWDLYVTLAPYFDRKNLVKGKGGDRGFLFLTLFKLLECPICWLVAHYPAKVPWMLRRHTVSRSAKSLPWKKCNIVKVEQPTLRQSASCDAILKKLLVSFQSTDAVRVCQGKRLGPISSA